jgi:hypothetical protein
MSDELEQRVKVLEQRAGVADSRLDILERLVVQDAEWRVRVEKKLIDMERSQLDGLKLTAEIAKMLGVPVEGA